MNPPIPQNYADLYAHYGDPDDPDFAAQHIVTVSHGINPKIIDGETLLEIVHIQCHKLIVPVLQAVWTDLHLNGHLGLIQTYDGCYDNRNVRGEETKSIHSWGLAIDLNAAQYPLGSDLRQPHDLTVAFEAQGFWYGGDYHHRKDPMHYQYAGDF
jgi:D-alanyl-D-alanine carboxypeptidase